MSCIEFTVNGTKCVVDTSTPRETSLNAYLRYTLCLPGTKAMCREGGCGICIVSVRARRYPSEAFELFSVNSCLVLVFSCHGWDITTIEGLGNRRKGYHDIQKRIAKMNGSQCGYCTPGWVMQLHSLVDEQHKTMAELEKSFGSNTCRCTGYRPILDTIKSYAIDSHTETYNIKDIEDLSICPKTKAVCNRKFSGSSDDSNWSIIDEIKIKNDSIIKLDFGVEKFFKVYEEEDIFMILNNYGYDSYMLADGNTAKGIVENFDYPRIIIDISDVTSLKSHVIDQNLVLGANLTLASCIDIFRETAASMNEFSYLTQFAEHFELVAHIPVRKIGTLAGNLVLKNHIPFYQSDVFLLFESVGAMITIRDLHNVKSTITMVEFLKLDLTGILILNIQLPPLGPSYTFKSYKIMPRHQNALAIVNSAFLLKITGNLVESASIVYGNISPDFIHASITEKFICGQNLFTNSGLQAALKVLNQDILPKKDPVRLLPEVRRQLAVGLFYKFILNIAPPGIVSSFYRSGGKVMERPLSKGSQDFQTDKKLFPLNEPLPKLEALIQSAGEAIYSNDAPKMPLEVFGAFVLSTIHSGEIDLVDTTSVLGIHGVVAVYTAHDIPGKNSFTKPGIQLITEDEEILASKDIKFYGQPVAIVVAVSEELARDVAKKVIITYKNIRTSRPILTINDAKKDSSRYLASDSSIKPSNAGTNVTKIVKGVYDIQQQYHYYTEPITCVVIPKETGIEVYDSSQWMDLTQIAVAQSLGIKESDVLVQVRRVGGAFGGKISRNVQAAAACAIVAFNMNTTCRFVLPIQTNMTIAGRRYPCQCEYEVGVDNDGKIQYLNANITEDDGCSRNENILDYTIGGFKNCYDVSTFSLKLGSVLTDLPSNSFMRAPGTSEGISCIEHIMEHIAFCVQRDDTEVRIANMRKEDNDLPELIEKLKNDSDYSKRCKDIENFNKANRWMKKAIQISVMSFPVEYYGNYSAIVSIYRGDGTVTVSTGGIEMGQGLNTKAAQVCAYALGIPLHLVSVLSSYTFTAANNVFSGSSITTECVSYSILKCCEMLKKRLAPIMADMPDACWQQIIKKAGDDLIDLTAIYMMTDKELEAYSAFAVAILETQLDVILGRNEILRVDILEDVGLSANPLLDVGQLEGGYVQGLGYFTSERMIFDEDTGKLLTNRSLNYHVPLALDIPADFRVKFRYNSKNVQGVLGSKTVGEMGMCTAHGITHALRKCIHASRIDSGYPDEWIFIDVPYDTESMLKALDVKIEEFLLTHAQ